MRRALRWLWFAPVLFALALWLSMGERGSQPRTMGRSELDSEPGPATLVAPAELAAAQEQRVEAAHDTRAATPAKPAPAAPFRGVVLDVETGEPVPWLVLTADGTQICTIGADARFASAEPLAADVQDLAFDDPVHGSNVRSISREELEPDPADTGGWIARIAVGPTYRLRVPEAEEAHLEGWQARLVVNDANGNELESHAWENVHPFEPPFLRYDNPKPTAPGSAFFVEVRNADGTREGRSAPLGSARGIHPEIVVIHADEERASVHGRVIDALGRPHAKATVTAAWLDRAGEPATWPATESGADGEFRFAGLQPGACRFTARPRRGQRPATLGIELAPGVTQLPDLVVPVAESAGMVEGRLVSASGAPLTIQEHVRLRALDGSGLDMLDITSSGGAQPSPFMSHGVALAMSARGGQGDLVFEFNETPPGRFELSVVGSSFLWDPPAIVVEAPSDTAVFRQRDDLARDELRLQAVDADTGAVLAPLYVQLQLAGAWNPLSYKSEPETPLGTLTAGLSLAWTVYAPGYRPAHGDERALHRTERGLEATVALVHGFGARFVLRDVGAGYLHDDEAGWISACVRPPVAGATILADGTALATSDAAGVADVALDHVPRRFEIRAPGWRVIGSEQFRDGRIVGEATDVLVWLIAE